MPWAGPRKKKIISRAEGLSRGEPSRRPRSPGFPSTSATLICPWLGSCTAGCPHHYRFARADESEEEFATRLAAELEQMIEREGPDTVAGFIAEPVMGRAG